VTPADDRTLDAMTRYGGSFVVALAEACRRADVVNFVRLQTAFPELFEEYRALAELKQRNWAR
jgi:hypothetical protein